MVDNEAPQGAPEATSEKSQEQEPEQKTTDWKAEARKWESRAKENLTVAKANEGAAKRLAEFEESQKTEAQKSQERLEAAEKRAAELELKATRAEVAAAKGVPVDLLNGSTQEELEAAADALIEFKGDAGKGPVIPGQGKTPTKGPTSPAESFAGFFESQLPS